MRFKAGIILLVLVTLFSLGGCVKPGDEKNAPVPSNISTVQETMEKLPAEKVNQTRTEAEEGRIDKELIHDRGAEESIANLEGGNIAASQTTGAWTTKSVNQAHRANQAKISITGPGIEASQEFTLKELQQMKDILVSANYFSRGAEKPGWGKTAHTAFSGVLLYELLADYGGLKADATQVKIIAEDNYTQVFSIEDIQADYIDETDSRQKLRMIIAWSQDGQEYDANIGAPFRLVMGQQFPGDYNRQKWVHQIAQIVVK